MVVHKIRSIFHGIQDLWVDFGREFREKPTGSNVQFCKGVTQKTIIPKSKGRREFQGVGCGQSLKCSKVNGSRTDVTRQVPNNHQENCVTEVTRTKVRFSEDSGEKKEAKCTFHPCKISLGRRRGIRSQIMETSVWVRMHFVVVVWLFLKTEKSFCERKRETSKRDYGCWSR